MPDYVLSWTTSRERLFDVALHFVAPADDPRLVLPAWRPGRYLIQNYAANVREWAAGGRRIWKDGKSSWRVAARAGEDVTVTYRYYAGVLDAGSSFLDDGEAYFNGSNLFMMVEGLRGEEHRLAVAAPAEWEIETQLSDVILSREAREGPGASAAGSVASLRMTLLARDYDHLIDSPTIAAARMTRHSFAESGATIHMIFRDDDGIDAEQFVEPVRKIVRAQAALFGGLPLTEYRFLYHVRDRWHGVEHEDSASIVVRRDALTGAKEGDDGWSHFLSLTSHEFFHLWNVKRIVPAAFTPYDYSRETPTRLLWVMEGVTSYYGDLMLQRSGLWSEAQYLEHLAKEIVTLESMPARRHLSLSQASFDGWLAEPAQQHDRGNAAYSFYNKGELVAALLDLTIRAVSGGAKSLDDVMRLLWSEYGLTRRGLEEDGFERAVARVADVGDFFARYVDGTDPLPYAEVFGCAGIRCEITRSDKHTLGATFRVGSSVFQSVHRDGAAFDAGAMPGDELLAISGARVTSESEADTLLRGVAEGERVEMLVVRAGILRTLSLPARRDPRPDVTLRRIE